jgi:plasmid stability protein
MAATRSLDPDPHRSKERARTSGRSLQQEVRAVLERAAATLKMEEETAVRQVAPAPGQTVVV